VGYRLDPEVAEALATRAAEPVGIVRGDWRALRETIEANLTFLATISRPVADGVRVRLIEVVADDGVRVRARWYTREGLQPGSAVVYAHGGGMIAGDVDAYESVVAGYVAAAGVPFLSVDYRLAPEVRGACPTEDFFAGLVWLVGHAGEMGISLERLAVMGDSGGGGIAASVAILARDRGVALARQILIYPMLDDRTETVEIARTPFLSWTNDKNATAWGARLGEAVGGAKVSPAIAPARLKDARELAPAYIEVGDLDLFRDEDIAYALKLAAFDVPIELHVHPGAPHGFDRAAPESRLTQRAMEDRLRVLREL
jgi:acetyl esterase/lipase